MKTMRSFLISFLFFIFGLLKSQDQNDFYISDAQGNQSLLVSCNYPFVNNNCISLTAHYPIFKLTDSYAVKAANFTPYSVTSKTVIKEDLDDVFTGIIDLPFSFCFYGKSYKQLVIGSNGMISFDISQANQPNAPNFSDTLPSQNLPKESIFGVLQDIYFSKSDDSEISYSVIGNAPFRKFIVNFYKGNLSGCETETSTSQIVLSEGSNTIEVFIENKDLPCNLAKFKNALIGINDATGASGLSAPGRNTGVWEAKKEAWLFSPASNNLVPQFIWYDTEGNVIGRDENQIVCVQKDEKYKVDIIFNACGDSQTYSDDINIKFAVDYPTVTPYTKTVCNVTDAITLADYKSFLTTNDASNFNFKFIDDSTGQEVDENIPFSINKDKIFSVIVSNKNLPECKSTTKLAFSFFSDKILTTNLGVCDVNNDGVEANYNLSWLNAKLVGNNYQGAVTYFASYNEAIDNKNPILNADVVNGTQFFVRLAYQSCVNVLGPIVINLNPTPVVVPSIDVELKICDNNDDGLENYDWVALVRNKITLEPNVSSITVYNSIQAAQQGNPSFALNQIRPGIYKVYARVAFPSGCYSIVEMNMNVIFGIIKLNDSNTDICFDGVEDIAVNLDELTKDMLIEPLDGTVTGPVFFGSYQDAVDNDFSKIIPADQLITDNGNFVTKTFYARFDKGTDCFSIKPVIINLIHLVKNRDQFSVCDFKNDGTETVQLSDYVRQVNNQSGTQVLFFTSKESAEANAVGTNLTSVTINGNTVIYARISYKDCLLIIPITFTLTNTPNVLSEFNVEIKNICDNNADGKENIDVTTYESQININNDNLEFSYYQNYNAVSNSFSNQYLDPTQVSLSNGSVVYVKAKYKNSACYSVSKINFTLEFYPPIYLDKNAVLKLCDKDLNFGESFNLSLATPQIFNQNNNQVQLSDLAITYYATEADANNGTYVGKIASPHTTSAANVFVYARFQSRTYGCYSVAPINLLSYFPVKAKNSVIQICDNNIDGFYDVNLLDYKDQMVQTPSPENVYTFYLNQADIGISGREIANPTNFILNPYTSKIWVYVENLKDCGSSAEINFVNGTQLTISPNQFSINDICDEGNDGKESINLSKFESNFAGAYTYEYFESKQDMMDENHKITNPSTYPFDESKGISKFYVKVSEAGLCPNFYTIDIQLNKTPIININDYYYCKNDVLGLDIKPNFTGLNVTYYKWEYPDGTVAEGSNQNSLTGVKMIGTYKLTLTNSSNCVYTTTFKVINIETPEIIKLSGENDNYVVTATGEEGRKIIYSKDLITWQDSNIFTNLQPGDYTFYVKYADSDCHGDMIRGRIFTVINAFTPNEDGINDSWKLSGLDVFPENSTLQIFDRYGSLVYQQTSNTEFVWDGKFNSRSLPTASYWYVINAADGRTYKGWILLKNRN